MPLSIFVDALPYSEIVENYQDWFHNMQIAELQPNIAYSSSLHWQLYCNKYPDDRHTFVDWSMIPETDKSICMISRAFSYFDQGGIFSLFVKKVLDRYIYRRNAFANIPFRFRKDFSEKGQYLFWKEETYSKEEVFQNYNVISQDVGHVSFEQAMVKLITAIDNKNINIMFVTGFADEIGHKNNRGTAYSNRLFPYMQRLHQAIEKYSTIYPDEDVLLISDHGMSTIKKRIDLRLEEKFGKQKKDTYIAYSDSCIMCIWSKKKELLKKINEYLLTIKEGHVVSEDERKYYHVTDRQFGDLIFILKEGICFANSWFGKSLKKTGHLGEGMHGFWPEESAKDQMATILLISNKHKLQPKYTYGQAYRLIMEIMQKKRYI